MDTSIIIPCFNSGVFLSDAVASAEQAVKGYDTEVVIVDDGSTDAETLNLLEKIRQQSNHIVLHQENGGPAAARNTGVKVSRGKYLLFLDSDNKIRPDFLTTTIPVLEGNPKAGVVYGNANFFGETDKRKTFNSHSFDKYKLIVDNYIDVCSLVRREAFEKMGGFDECRDIIGYEDWEFWIRLSAASWQFIYLPVILFDYRIRINSVISVASKDENYKKVLSYVYSKNASTVLCLFNELYHESLFYKYDKENPTRAFLKYFKKNIFPKLSNNRI
jgi:GT2 family glycosyltransferase